MKKNTDSTLPGDVTNEPVVKKSTTKKKAATPAPVVEIQQPPEVTAIIPKKRKQRKSTEETVVPVQIVEHPALEDAGKASAIAYPKLVKFISYLLLLLSVFTISYQQYQIMGLQKDVKFLTPFALRNIELSDLNYYKEAANNLVINTTQSLWELPEEEYIVYFYRSNCDYCETANRTAIIPYIQKGYTSQIKLYFVNLDKNEFLYATDAQTKVGFVSAPTPANFYILGTPTMLHIKGTTTTAYIGADQIPAAITNLIK